MAAVGGHAAKDKRASRTIDPRDKWPACHRGPCGNHAGFDCVVDLGGRSSTAEDAEPDPAKWDETWLKRRT